jgi:hypothetical protein
MLPPDVQEELPVVLRALTMVRLSGVRDFETTGGLT